jgi:hypothetical protein
MISKAQQTRIASALAGLPVPPKGGAMVRQSDQKPRTDLVTTRQLARRPADAERTDLVTTRQLARKRAAASSVHTTSGGGYSAPPADGSRGSLRSDIRAAFER